jgi:2-isopropylmalate synthase
MLKNNETYEIMRPESVGVGQTRLVLGKHSGRHAFKVRLAELGHVLTDEDLQKTFASFKKLADKKKIITDADLESMVADGSYRPVETYTLETLQVSSGTAGMPTATVRLRTLDGRVLIRAAVGSGSLDACCKAIDAAVGNSHKLVEMSVHGSAGGADPAGSVTARIEYLDADIPVSKQGSAPGRMFSGHGADADVIVAGARAYLAAINKLFVAMKHQENAPEAAKEAVTLSKTGT